MAIRCRQPQGLALSSQERLEEIHIMKSLLIIAHGSRRLLSNDEVRALTESIKARVTDTYSSVHCAFLELAEPSIPQGIELCANDGADEVIVMPYFLSAGRHVSEDIPSEVSHAQKNHPHLTIRIIDYLGSLPSIPDLIANQATHAAETCHANEEQKTC